MILDGFTAVTLFILRTGAFIVLSKLLLDLTVSSMLPVDLTTVIQEASRVMSDIVSSVLVGVEHALLPLPFFLGVFFSTFILELVKDRL